MVLVVLAYKFLSGQTAAPYGQTLDQSSYSVSAVGFTLFYEYLKAEKRPIHRSLVGESWKPAANQLAISPEPVMSILKSKNLSQAPLLLVILPKYNYEPDPKKPNWLLEAKLKKNQALTPVLNALDLKKATFLYAPNPDWWPTKYKLYPTINSPVQLIKEPSLSPLISCPDGVLLGERRQGDKRLLILSDPDILNNHGLRQGLNLPLAMSILDDILPKNGEIIFDEPRFGTHKPATQASGQKSSLFEWPSGQQLLLYAVFLATAIMAILADDSRFGLPAAEDVKIDFGRQKLIENSARLLGKSGKPKDLTWDYLALIIKMAAKAARLPKGLTDQEIKNRLEKLDPKFSLKSLLNEIERAPKPSPGLCLQWANRAYEWKARLERGFETGRGNNQGHPGGSQ
jgi:hypothetical protein